MNFSTTSYRYSLVFLQFLIFYCYSIELSASSTTINKDKITIDILLPEEFKDIKLNLNGEELLKLRPSIVSDEYLKNPSATAVYGEQIDDHPFFNSISYEVYKNKLRTITISGSWPEKILMSHRKEFLNWLRLTLGEPMKATIRRIRRKVNFNIPVYFWSGNDYEIVVSYTPSVNKQGLSYNKHGDPYAPYFFEIIISRTSPGLTTAAITIFIGSLLDFDGDGMSNIFEISNGFDQNK